MRPADALTLHAPARSGEPAEYSANRRLRWRWPLIAAAAGSASYVASLVLARTPDFVETWYTTGLWPLLSRPLSLITGIFPFAVADLLIAAYVLWVGATFVRAVRHVIARRRHWSNALLGGLRDATRDAGAFVALLYWLWGFNYARPALETRLGWPGWSGANAEELSSLATQAVAAANKAYIEIHGTRDAGHPTLMPPDKSALDAAIDEGWTRAAHVLALPPGTAARFGPVKFPWSTPIYERLGITGLYTPLTAEANVPAHTPAVKAPSAMAHEKAHQRGFAGEAEAGFAGFIAGSLAPHAYSRYAAAMYAQGQLMPALAIRAPGDWRRLNATRFPGTRRDRDDLNAYYRRHDGVVQTAHRALNDRYLRANGVAGGVSDYSRAMQLLIAWSRQNGGQLFPRSEFVSW